MHHGLRYISFYVKKRVVSMGMCYNPALVRDKPLGSHTYVKRVYCLLAVGSLPVPRACVDLDPQNLRKHT